MKSKFVNIEISIQLYRKQMFQPFLFVHLTPLPLTLDIFEKYRQATEVEHLPFRLYSTDPQPTEQLPEPQRSGTRGPYRRYSREEKEAIIMRMLDGATLKSIAEETAIPKRNLIRWKHEFLHGKSIFASRKNSSTEDCRSQSRNEKEWIQTNESISEEQHLALA